MYIAVISRNGMPLMPTNVRKMRRFLKAGRARIVCHSPLAVQLNYDPENAGTQDMELTVDTGYACAGLSVKSEKHEYISEELKFLTDEKQHHQKQKRTRNARRNRKHYRKPMTKRERCSRKKRKGWMAPSIRNKADRHIDRIRRYCRYFPVTSITLEMGQFDTAVLAAVSEGKPVPEGITYQHGPKYGYDTLREAVFARDKYRCRCCGKSAVKDGVILVIHHLGFRKKDRSNRMSNLAAVCSKCHTAANHKPGGKLWELSPKAGSQAPASFMNQVKWYIYTRVSDLGIPVGITYGAVTKRERLDRNIQKSHADDAYCIGSMHPMHRCRTRYFEKRRRNDRRLEKFYDAVYLDIRDGSEKKASELGCNRTKRSVPRDNPENLRRYRGKKIKKGRRQIRTQRYPVKAGDLVLYEGRTYTCGGQQHHGARVILKNYYPPGDKRQKSVSTDKIKRIRYYSGWTEVSKEQFYNKKKDVRDGAA